MTNIAPEHPGSYIRSNILPSDMTVKAAALRLGVGRPALSNLLNGKASLSPEMALRIEKAFSAKSDELLNLQAAFDEWTAREREPELAVRTYAPSFLQITATQIDAWADRVDTRPLLPVLVRRLVLGSQLDITSTDFPAYDNSQRHGWDGLVDSKSANPWVPLGRSGWEFGCDQSPAQKAEHDYDARTTSIPASDRKQMTFVFVTPRNWSGGQAWAKTKRAEKKWRDVRVIDASALEQWLEQVAPAQAWLAERLGIPTDQISSLEAAWDDWAQVTEPALSRTLFKSQIAEHEAGFRKWLSEPPTRPYVVAADSIEEGLAYLGALFVTSDGMPHDRVLVFRTVEGLRKATRASSTFIAALASPAVEAASSGIHKRQHTIIVRPRNSIADEPDVALDLVDDETFKQAILEMGLPEDDVRRLERDSAQSPTVLRRILSPIPEIRMPPWANAETARMLIPIFFAGAWDSGNKADQEVLTVVSERTYDEVERIITTLLGFDQTPVWSVGKFRGLISKTDALFAIHRSIARKDLEHFFFTAEYVLSEDDPSLDMPDEDRWTAGMYGKTRNHSGSVREGFCETLVILAVHGNHLFQERLGLDVEAHVNALVRRLLTPLNARTWEAQESDLPRYAEAAPETFLDVLEEDLRAPAPEILKLLRPAGSGIFGGCPRSGLLWALEGLAWRPDRLARVAMILARLSQVKIEDNWVNKPIASLQAIFRSWMPQTSATVDERLAVLQSIITRYPDIGWQICMAQLDTHSRMGAYSHKPRWRNEGSGAGHVVTNHEDHKTRRKALDLALVWPNHTEMTLGDLTESIHLYPADDQHRIWDLVEAWTKGSSEEAKAELRERIRRHTFTRRGKRKGLSKALRGRVVAIYVKLAPNDPVVRHQWLFAKQWVDESYEELEEVEFDFRKRDERIKAQRITALSEIWHAAGYDGIMQLAEKGDAAYAIGVLLAEAIGLSDPTDMLARLATEPPSRMPGKIDWLIAGVLGSTGEELRLDIFERLRILWSSGSLADDGHLLRILKAAPFVRSTWDFAEAARPAIRSAYWQEVSPSWGRFESADFEYFIERLLEFNRPRAAIHASHMDWAEISSPLLLRLLKEGATNLNEPSGHYQFQGYDIAEAMKVLAKRPDIGADDLALLEFFYLRALEDTDYGIPNLERQLTDSPALFAQFIGLLYKRSDEGEDPPEWRTENMDVEGVAQQAYHLLQRAGLIPGTSKDGSVDVVALNAWIQEVRALCRKYARETVGDHVIGELLSKSPAGEDGIWPRKEVREAIEETQSVDIADGVALGVYNGRGAHWRGPDGGQERELADKYRNWARLVTNETPFVGRMLENIAKRYDRDAVWHDTDAEVRKRLRH